jgi:hypothetical protein
LEKVTAIARVVREELQKEKHPLWSTWNLEAACAVASEILVHVLRARGLRATFVVGEFKDGQPRCNDEHCWVTLPVGRILDITATQFGSFPEIQWASVGDPQYRRKYRGKRAYSVGWVQADFHSADFHRVLQRVRRRLRREGL